MKRSYYNPDTHKAVPIEPDENMVDAAYNELYTVETLRSEVRRGLKAAIAAAPEVPEGDGDGWLPIADALHQAEDAESAHLCLTEAGVPLADERQEQFSLWGRIVRYAENVKNGEQPAAAELRCHRCGHVTTVKFGYAKPAIDPLPPPPAGKESV